MEEAWGHMKTVIQNAMLNCIPKVRKCNKKRFIPVWMNKKVLRKIKKKYNVYKRYLSTKSGQHYQRCIRESNKCTKLLRKTRKEYEKQVAKEDKTNPKSFWR